MAHQNGALREKEISETNAATIGVIRGPTLEAVKGAFPTEVAERFAIEPLKPVAFRPFLFR